MSDTRLVLSHPVVADGRLVVIGLPGGVADGLVRPRIARPEAAA